MQKSKKLVMYVDGIKSIYKDVLKLALSEQKSLDAMKKELIERFRGHNVTFKLE